MNTDNSASIVIDYLCENMRRKSISEDDLTRLSDFVRRVMNEEGLSAAEIERRSGNCIDEGTVSDILRKKSSNIGINTLRCLAKGLGVDPLEVCAVILNVKMEPAGKSGRLLRKLQAEFSALSEAQQEELDWALKGLSGLIAERRKTKRTAKGNG